MCRLPKIFLLLSSFVFFVTACKYSKYNHLKDCSGLVTDRSNLIPVIQNNNTLKFKANIGIMNNNFSGIMLVKATDSLHQHIVFVNELGMKLFDFNVSNNFVEATYVFSPMNKPALVTALKRNMKHLLLIGMDHQLSQKCAKDSNKIIKTTREKYHYFFKVTNEGHLKNQDVFFKKKLESTIEYSYDTNTQSYSNILCRQNGYGNISIELQQLITE